MVTMLQLQDRTHEVVSSTSVISLGSLINAGLPNVTGGANLNYISITGVLALSSPVGAFKIEESTGGSHYYSDVGASSGSPAQIFSFDASDSNNIYGSSTTVTPASLKVAFYIRY